MTTYMHYATLLEAASAVRSRKVSAAELTRAMLDRIAKIDPSLRSYATVTPEFALAQAEASDVEIAAGNYRGPLHGVLEYGGLADLIEAGRATSGIEIMEAHHKRLAFTGSLAVLFADIDLLLIPTQTLSDFTIAQERELFATAEGLSGFVRFATPFDMSGSPTITLPGGFTEKGLPVSFQLVGRHLEEALLVRAGHAYQQFTDWHHRHPSL